MGIIEYNKMKNIVESLLFISKKPVSLSEFSEVTGFDGADLENVIKDLKAEYESRGLQIISLANGYVMATRPQYSEYVEKFLNSPVSVTLSSQSLETLSIIAYKQPLTKAEVESIRGVLCDGVIKTLLDKRLIKESGRSEHVGRPILYSTTVEFLKHFGLHDLSELPPLETEDRSRTALFEIAPEQTESINA